MHNNYGKRDNKRNRAEYVILFDENEDEAKVTIEYFDKYNKYGYDASPEAEAVVLFHLPEYKGWLFYFYIGTCKNIYNIWLIYYS